MLPVCAQQCSCTRRRSSPCSLLVHAANQTDRNSTDWRCIFLVLLCNSKSLVWSSGRANDVMRGRMHTIGCAYAGMIVERNNVTYTFARHLLFRLALSVSPSRLGKACYRGIARCVIMSFSFELFPLCFSLTRSHLFTRRCYPAQTSNPLVEDASPRKVRQ